MDQRVVEARMYSLMNQHGLVGWKFRWNTNKARSGVTKYFKKKDGVVVAWVRTIELSAPLCALKPMADIEQTMLHEIAHALVGPGHGHGPVWKNKARSIGYTGGRTTSSDVRLPTLWTGTCGNGHSYGRNRLTERVRTGAYCLSCGGRRSPIAKIVWERT